MSSARTLLVLPCYNDVARLREFLPLLLRGLPQRFLVLVSDDGSSEAEREDLCRLIQRSREGVGEWAGSELDVVFAEKNTGKGGAVMRAWARSDRFDMLAFADADGAVGVGEILRAESFFRSEEAGAFSALFASRVKMLGRSVERSLKRHLLGRVFATLVSIIGDIPAYDTQCGLKIVRKQAYQKIEPFIKTQGFAFDVELCLLLRKFEFTTVEFPIDWRDVPGSKVSLLRDSWRMAREVVRIQKRVAGLDLDSLKMV
jgi:glycosyltransferase involved in cell wall biosynthesis